MRNMKNCEKSVAAVDGLYRSVRKVIDPIAREWYMNECVAGGWSSRDLDRQVSTKYSTVMPSDEILRREIETQKELYRLQMQSEAMPELKRSIRAKKKGGRK